MLTTKNINKLANEQIGHEFAAFIQYVAMAAYFNEEGLTELSGYFYKQAEEEREHALKFVKFLCDAGAPVEIPAIPKPAGKFKSVEAAVKIAYDQEMKVTHQVETLFQLAMQEKNYITQNFLQWFLKEQLEEVSSMDALLKVIRHAGPNGLMLVEEHIARHGHPEDK